MSKLAKTVLAGALAVILTSCLGCSDSDTYNPIYAQYVGPPVVTGMIFTDERGNYAGVWGEPTSTVAVFPNPTNGPVTIARELKKACRVWVWIVKAYGPGESYDPLISSGGGVAYVPYGAPVRVLIENEYFEAGVLQIVWDCTDDFGDVVPSGFYRIYTARGNSLEWGDFLLARDCSDLPYYINLPECD